MVSAEPLAKSPWRRARWLILSPHPDDETLGCGALIANVARASRLAGIVYLTDGTGSHPAGTSGLATARKREAGHAVRRLAGGGVRIDWLAWRDADPHDDDDPAFGRDAGRLAAWCRQRRVDAIAVTDAFEPHCDHAAAYRLANAAACLARRPIALFAYHVWSPPPSDRNRRVRTTAIKPGRRRRALRAHRSQLTPAFGAGFRLDRAQQRMAAIDCLTLRKVHP